MHQHYGIVFSNEFFLSFMRHYKISNNYIEKQGLDEDN